MTFPRQAAVGVERGDIAGAAVGECLLTASTDLSPA